LSGSVPGHGLARLDSNLNKPDLFLEEELTEVSHVSCVLSTEPNGEDQHGVRAGFLVVGSLLPLEEIEQTLVVQFEVDALADTRSEPWLRLFWNEAHGRMRDPLFLALGQFLVIQRFG